MHENRIARKLTYKGKFYFFKKMSQIPFQKYTSSFKRIKGQKELKSLLNFRSKGIKTVLSQVLYMFTVND